ncbi:MAG: hypothetical protein IJ570_08745 [Prevotella sp.]|nr:hypothetical protein [Prevotella sp.]
MNILHVYDEGDSMAARYVAMLTAAIGDSALMRSATTQSSFSHLTEVQRPDIVHVHGTLRFPIPSGIRLVITPHGLPLTQTKAYVIVARSQMECDSLAEQHERIELVRNPIITRTTTPEACGRQMLSIYHRIMNSNVLAMMSDNTRLALKILLAVAAYGDRRWIKNLPSFLSTYSANPENVNFQQLYIYTDFEGVLPLLEEGIGMMGIKSPLREHVETYLPDGFRRPEPMGSGDVVSLVSDIKQQGPSLLRLSEIAKALHDDALDENILLTRLDEKGLRPLFSSILQLLSEQFLLSEGFMPCAPADNSVTLQLRQQLTKRQDVMA